MAVLGLVGSGNIGGTVARLAVAAGHHVILSNSRGPLTLLDLAAELGPLAGTGTSADAAQRGELVLVSVPLRAYREVPVAPLAGKVVMDANNYYPQRDGHIGELDDGSTTGSELLQRHLPDARVVKVFNNINYRHLASLARPHGAGDRSALFIAGDDADAKGAVAAFLDSIGYDAVDAGALGAGGRIFQVGAAAYGTLYGSMRDPHGEPTGADELRHVLETSRH